MHVIAFRLILGTILVALGIAGSLLPILQGWIFFLLAVIVLFPGHPRVQKLIARLEEKHPSLRKWFLRLRVHDESNARAHESESPRD